MFPLFPNISVCMSHDLFSLNLRFITNPRKIERENFPIIRDCLNPHSRFDSLACNNAYSKDS